VSGICRPLGEHGELCPDRPSRLAILLELHKGQRRVVNLATMLGLESSTAGRCGWNASPLGWKVSEGRGGHRRRPARGSVALVGFGIDSSIEVISALGLLRRLRTAGANATVQEESGAQRHALYILAAPFLPLAANITLRLAPPCWSGRIPTARPWGWS
jgi:hypothetical protein